MERLPSPWNIFITMWHNLECITLTSSLGNKSSEGVLHCEKLLSAPRNLKPRGPLAEEVLSGTTTCSTSYTKHPDLGKLPRLVAQFSMMQYSRHEIPSYHYVICMR